MDLVNAERASQSKLNGLRVSGSIQPGTDVRGGKLEGNLRSNREM
jgi:hypothetical protein